MLPLILQISIEITQSGLVIQFVAVQRCAR